jgi:hypothetical protein
VPCDYELNGQILDAVPFLVIFGFAAGQRAPDRGGVEPESIVVVDGPLPQIRRGSGSFPECIVQFGFSTILPANFRIRFRVVPDIREGTRCG